MRLAFVNSTRRWGGVKTWCMDMARSARRHGHDACIYGRDDRFVHAAQQEGMLARRMRFGADFNPVAIASFYREFRRQRISHVIVNVGKDLRTAGIAARLAGIPVVVHVGAPADFSNTRLRHMVHQCVRPAYVCCSEFTRQHIVSAVPWLQNAMVCAIHPGTPMPAEAPCPSHQPYTLITSSQLTLPKRHADLIRACALLPEETFTLRIVGTGDQEENLKKLTHELGLEKRIEFRGYVPSVASELRQADIFILPTDAEPLGIALEEAMAHGLFPLARHAGGVPEIWPTCFMGELLPPQAGPQEFAHALRKILALTPDELNARRVAVQKHARIAFDLDKQFQAFAAFLASLS